MQIKNSATWKENLTVYPVSVNQEHWLQKAISLWSYGIISVIESVKALWINDRDVWAE